MSSTNGTQASVLSNLASIIGAGNSACIAFTHKQNVSVKEVEQVQQDISGAGGQNRFWSDGLHYALRST